MDHGMPPPPPQVPMPPPAHGQPMYDAWPQHDNYGPEPVQVVHEHDTKPKNKDKDKDKKLGPVEEEREGYMLQPLRASSGQKQSWELVGKNQLPFTSDKLRSMVIEHRNQTRARGPEKDWAMLSSQQQGVINRVIAMRQKEEKHPNAEWYLLDVQLRGRTKFGQITEVSRIQIIIKRRARDQGKRFQDGNDGHQYGEIIDMREPMKDKKDKKEDKKGNKKEQLDDIMGILEPNGGHGGGHGGHGGQPMPIPVNNWGPDPHPQPPPMPIYAGPPPPQPILVDDYNRGRHDNPFDPRMPEPFNGPLFDGPYERPNARVRTARSPTPHRRPSLRRRRSSSARRLRELRNEMRDGFNGLQGQMENLRIGDNGSNSSEYSGSRYEEDDFWDRRHSDNYSTPPSSPARSVVHPRGSLNRGKSGDRRRDRQYYPNSRERRPRYDRPRDYDDYPRENIRYIEPRPVRRITNYAEGFDRADFGRPRREAYDPDHDAYEAGRRAGLHERRQRREYYP